VWWGRVIGARQARQVKANLVMGPMKPSESRTTANSSHKREADVHRPRVSCYTVPEAQCRRCREDLRSGFGVGEADLDYRVRSIAVLSRRFLCARTIDFASNRAAI
jgi:hypothetical protein